jgi:flagellar protein FlaF
VNATEHARQAYAPVNAPMRDPRAIEFQLFSQVTARLQQAAAGLPATFPKLAEALHENRKMWTLLATDVADPGNALPATLRAQIFYLAEFTMLHSQKVLSGDATAAALVDINSAIMRGLSGRLAVPEVA